MRRWSIPIVSLILLGSLAFGQEPTAKNDMFSSDLVMWSYMQEPQPQAGQARQTPTPDPNPETQPQPNPTAPKPQQNPPAAQPKEKDQPSSDKSQTATAQSFTGTISKHADNFILQVST